MGKLERGLARFVETRVRKRGADYYRDGRVTIRRAGRDSADAVVKGGRAYEVSLTRAGSTLVTSCECPFYEGEIDVCKHIWATVLVVDRRNLMPGKLPTAIDVANGRIESTAVLPDDVSVRGDENDAYDEEWDDDPVDLEFESHALAFLAPRRESGSRSHASTHDWKLALADRSLFDFHGNNIEEYFHPEGEFRYILMPSFAELGANASVIVEFTRPKKTGGRTTPKIPTNLLAGDARRLPDETDREIFARCASTTYQLGGRFTISDSGAPYLFPVLCGSGRFFARPRHGGDMGPLTIDDGGPWRFDARARRDEKGLLLEGRFVRGDEELAVNEPFALFASGLFVHAGRIFTFSAPDDTHWLRVLRGGELRIPKRDEDRFVSMLMTWENVPPIELPDDLVWDVRELKPLPRLAIRGAQGFTRWLPPRVVELSFDYAGRIVPSGDPAGFVATGSREAIRRDAEAERSARALVMSLGARSHHGVAGLEVEEGRVAAMIRRTLSEGWHVEIDGRRHRRASMHEIRITTGIDWFDVEGDASYDGARVSLPELLAAARKGAGTIVLSDGSIGAIPEELIQLSLGLMTFGEENGERIRFLKSQASLLDALLVAQENVTVDASFAKIRERLRDFAGIEPGEAPPGFHGTLRGYQKDALGWFRFLEEMGFGGCLADDMGLGKTVQVLALLESRRSMNRPAKKPSLVVVPRSLVFNWMAEAAKFTPKLKLLDHSGNERLKDDAGQFEKYDVVVTTYGTLRRDAAHLSKIDWDYAILDESQSVKNSATQSAKAVRLLHADHRLALSGTPIENHLGELWSLFEFLNPGMLGASSAFRSVLMPSGSDESVKREAIARLVRPFILRRTKEQVAKELPRRTEQTVFCEMGPRQRKLYEELRDHYRTALSKRIGAEGLAKSKLHVLEALLRLRQAACHPGLVNQEHASVESAKLEELFSRVTELVEEDHKILVFSQFTSFLALVKAELDRRKLDYCYLDGRTRNRAAVVKRFQEEPETRVFLISLKAGGLGLNLTEADYVILLDPWWNPAVEAQAIDRAHRIGQKRHVIAYRLVARDTVEEKILELQKTKRDLADAILGEDKSLIGGLQKDDIEFLLS